MSRLEFPPCLRLSPLRVGTTLWPPLRWESIVAQPRDIEVHMIRAFLIAFSPQ